MTYSQSKKQTDAEKKLQSLRMQLYGKEEKQPQKSPERKLPNSKTFQLITTSSTGSTTTLRESNYLKKDLLKTLVLATFAIAAQLLLYFSVTKGLLKL